jgi:YbbR domain-containing protein
MASKSERLRKILQRNRGLKAAALVLAFVTWYAIRSVINFETVVSDIPLTVQVNPGWAILDRSAQTVDILFRGSQEDIRYMNRDQIKVEVDIRGKPFAEALNVKLQPKNVQVPGAVRAAAIWPDEITLKLDQEGEKQVPVKADMQGSVPEGYEVDMITCSPASVLLQGPRQRLDEIELVRTVPIDLEGRIRSFKKLKMPVVSPGENWVGRVNPSNVAVEVAIVERSATRELQDLPVTVLVQPGSRPLLDLWPLKVNVVLKGVVQLVQNVNPEEVQASVDCSTLQGAASYNLPVRVHAPAGITAVSIEPPTVKVTVGNL